MASICKQIQQRSVTVLTAFAVAVVVLVSGVITAVPAAAATTGAEAQFISKLNGARASRGIHRVAMRSDLVTVARAQATRMANRDTLYHNPNLTRDVRNWRWVGENVGYGPDAPTIHTAFMNSPAHKANILDRDYTEVGIGVVVRNGRVWVAEVFRRPASALSTARSTGTATTSTTWRTLRLGSKGPAVKRVQQRLGLRQTGYYGASTRRAVLRFQARRGWSPVGIVGPLTRRALRV